MDEARPVDGQINLARRIPEFVGKPFLWLVPAPERGAGQFRYSETPVMTRDERAALEPAAAIPAPPMPHPEPVALDARA